MVRSSPAPRPSFTASKKTSLAFSWAWMGALSCMLMARRPACSLLLAGQTPMHSPQPVQSSPKTCSV
jgi:hypothetical protein